LRDGRSSGTITFVKVENDSRFHQGPVVIDAPSGRPLSTIPLNKPVRIERLEGPKRDCDRLLDLGFTPGEIVAVTHLAPLGDPLVVRVRGALLALRKREAAWIWVE
jgi:ferrous iron transport protein A